MSYEQKFQSYQPLPPEPTVPAGCLFTLYRQVGNLLILSGYGPFMGTALPPQYVGRAGGNVTNDTAVAAATLTGMNLLLIARQAIGTLDNVVQIVSVEGLVNSTDSFTDQPTIINGCSQRLIDIFGPVAGVHTRTASGTNTLAFGIVCEISMTLQVR